MNLLSDKILFPNLGLEFEVNVDAFTIFGLSIKWYAVIITIGMILAMIYGFSRMEKFGVDEDRGFDAVIGGIVGGLIGARLFYVIFAWDQFSGNVMKIFDIRSGGLAIYGGLIGGILVACIIAKIRKLRILPLLDVAAPCFLIGQGIGRWGNFFNQEAFGSNTELPWGMTSEKIQYYLTVKQSSIFETTGVTVDPLLPVHPCFLYESIGCLVGVLALHFLAKRRKFDGEVFLTYLAWYGTIRAIIEGFRTDSLMLGTIRISQLLSILFVITSVILIIIFRNRAKRMGEEYILYKDSEESKLLIAETQEKYDAIEAKKAEKKKLKKDELPCEKILIDEDDTSNEDIIKEDEDGTNN